MQDFFSKFLICGTLVLLSHVVNAQDSQLALPATVTTAAFRHPDCPLIDDPLHSVLLPHPNDCSKYYSCLKGYAFTLNCPNNLHWSILTYRCDYPEVAKCPNQYIPTSPEPPSTIKSTPSTVPEAALYYSYPGNCNRFYQCQPMHCPDNLYWNNQLQRCDWSPSAECGQQAFTSQVQPSLTTAPSTDVPPTAFTPPTKPNSEVTLSPNNPANSADSEFDRFCLNAESGIYIKHPTDCNKFIQCSNGIAYVHVCPMYLYWNSQKKVCDRFCI